jgi:hypothetical protein
VGTIGRPTRAAAGPVGHRTHGLFPSAAAQPPEGKLRLRFSIRWLARNIRLSTGPVRQAVCRLVAQGALRLVQRSETGHVVEVLLPGEIRPERLNGIESRAAVAVKEDGAGAGAAIHIEDADFLQNTTLRKAIHAP